MWWCYFFFPQFFCKLGEQSKQNTSIHCFPGHSPTCCSFSPICFPSGAQAPSFSQSVLHLCPDIASLPPCSCRKQQALASTSLTNQALYGLQIHFALISSWGWKALMRGKELDDLYVVVKMANRICLFKVLSLMIYKFSTSVFKKIPTNKPPKTKQLVSCCTVLA